MTSSREKIEESFALLNSLWAATQDASSAASPRSRGQASSASMATFHAGRSNDIIQQSAMPPTSFITSSPNKAIFPPTQRAPVLDKLAKLTAKRPTLHDSIAASISKGASVSKGAPGEPPQSYTNLSASSSTPLSNKSPSATQSPKGAPKTNRYLPWSREQFHERLATFKPSTWFDKPRIVNPVECARYGWINKGDDRLECFGGCGGVAIMRAGFEQPSGLPSSAPTSEDTESNPIAQEELQTEPLVVADDDDVDAIDFDTEAFGPKFHALLTSSHAKACPWKSHPCDDEIFKFPVLSRTQAKQEYLDRVTGLDTMKDEPLVAKIHHSMTRDELETLKAAFPNHSENVIILALFGWQRLQNDTRGSCEQKVIGCTACHTQCTYIPSMTSSFTNKSTLTIDDDSDLGDEESQDGFHVVGSHKWYCYWIDPAKSQEPGREGWRVLFSALTGPSKHTEVENTYDGTCPLAKKPRLEPREALARVKRIIRGGL